MEVGGRRLEVGKFKCNFSRKGTQRLQKKCKCKSFYRGEPSAGNPQTKAISRRGTVLAESQKKTVSPRPLRLCVGQLPSSHGFCATNAESSGPRRSARA